ncbi:adenine phosphoribosyltransferase [Deinobacterium chartae]|uniref:Adenine phosphoribosyltransferase n=1 Tax=Deinobacterium chartae TaxID=521158 RepID=A0A841I380_9DEIO|nr:phosphoribosyltransferase family protein [Deinobacterium chartae]MBB6099484.1 adenine phosphoribosyltransferase [Deinobacterium chartae]
MKTYRLSIGNVERDLPYIDVSTNSGIPFVELLGDVELTNAVADELMKLIPQGTDLLFTVATSGVPLGHALSERLGIPYRVARKRRRTYMRDPLIQEVASMTLGVSETLWLDRRHAEFIAGKRVAIVTDVVVSGATMLSLARLVERAGGTVNGYYAGFVQGQPSIDIKAVQQLPVTPQSTL